MNKTTKKDKRSSFKELLIHAKNYVTADLFAKGLMFLSIPILTRLLTTSDYGILGVFTSVTSILIIIFGLGIRGAVTRYYYEDKLDFGKFLGTNITFLIVFGVFLTLILSVFKDSISSFFRIPSNLFIYAIIIAVFSVAYEIYKAFLQASKNSKKYSILGVVKSLFTLSLTLIIILQLEKDRYLGQVYAQLIVIVFISIYSLVKILKLSKLNINKQYLKYSLIFGIPVVFHLLSQTVLSSFDQIIINQLVGERETGLYTFAFQIGLIQSIISMGVLRAWTPIFYEKLKQKKHREIEELVVKYSIIIYILALCLILFSYEIIFIMADQKFYSSQEMVPIIVLSYVFFFLYTIYVGYSFYHKKTYLIAIFTLIAGIINIILNYTLIPIYGFEVAAFTTLISYALLFLLHYLNVKFIIRENNLIRLGKILPNLFIMIVVVVTYAFIEFNFKSYIIQLIFKLLLLLTMLLLFFYKRISLNERKK